MKPKRVDCMLCEHFIFPVYDSVFLNAKIVKNAKCSLGKRVMFRKPNFGMGGYPLDTGGWFRYCDKFISVFNND